jgi:hypothetical protein
MKKAYASAISAEQDRWLRRAYAEARAAGRDLIGAGGSLHSSAAIGRLSDCEWGWISSSIIWTWVKVRSEQAVSEGWGLEEAARRTKLAPCPWDMGSVLSILPQLAQTDFDWSLPIGSLPKEMLAQFLLTAFNLIQHAMIARDVIEEQLDGKPVNAGAVASNSRMTPDALNRGDCPF